VTGSMTGAWARSVHREAVLQAPAQHLPASSLPQAHEASTLRTIGGALVTKWLSLLSAVALYATASSSSSAQEATCGTAPTLPTSSESAESIKGQLQGQADFLSKMVGKAELAGEIEAARKTIYQSSDNFFAAQKDAYLAYVFCVLITDDKSLSTIDKLKGTSKNRRFLPPRESDSRFSSSERGRLAWDSLASSI
jgi:hypothetical protein